MKIQSGDRFKPKKRIERKTKRTNTSAFKRRYGDLVGTIHHLPPDMAEQHDHYIHGKPIRK